jgi:hypothetical protein
MNGSSLLFVLKQEKWHTKDTLSFKPSSRMALQTWPIHIEKSVFIGHFTSICHRNCVRAIFNTQWRTIDCDCVLRFFRETCTRFYIQLKKTNKQRVLAWAPLKHFMLNNVIWKDSHTSFSNIRHKYSFVNCYDVTRGSNSL